jgi:hypothetical protein
MRRRAHELFGRAAALAGELGLPVEVLDAEVLLDGEHGTLHHVRWADCDVRPFVSTLSREFDLHLTLTDLTGPGAEPEEEDHGCGREGCGAGGCGSCGAGGCGSCGSEGPADLKAYFAELRAQMERRTSLL